jgi:uroporphyrinogen decarboxylase
MAQNFKNDLFLRALRRQATERTPVWLMRQAGRYLPEYNATRKQAGDFMSLCKNPELACEVTLQPIDRYGLDAAILFSDILTIPDAMGLGLYFVQGEGPCFKRRIESEADIAALGRMDPSVELNYVAQAVSTIKKSLDRRVPLIGFSGSPWTLACYMINGGSSGDDFLSVRKWLYSRPDALQRLLEKLSQAVSDYLIMQIEAGADAVMVFDSWGGFLPEAHFERFSQQHIRTIVEQVAKASVGIRRANGETDNSSTPMIVFVKGGGQWLESIANTGADAVGIDWATNLGHARSLIGDRCALQGNLDPASLLGTASHIESEVARTLDSFGRVGPGVGHVFNLGHGISQFTPPENVACLVEAVANYSKKLR